MTKYHHTLRHQWLCLNPLMQQVRQWLPRGQPVNRYLSLSEGHLPCRHAPRSRKIRAHMIESQELMPSILGRKVTSWHERPVGKRLGLPPFEVEVSKK